MAKRKKLTDEDRAAFDARTRVIEERIENLRRRIAEREQAEQKRDR
jgi:hypothetical protein